MTKKQLYDFRANWRQSYFYDNPNDNVVLPIAAVGSGLGTGLTDNHDWDTVRKFGSADLTLHATNNLRFNFNYYRTSDSGPTFTTESLDFFDSPSYWGTLCARQSLLSVRAHQHRCQSLRRRNRLHLSRLDLPLQHRLSDRSTKISA